MANLVDSTSSIGGDRALDNAEGDRLGFKVMASSTAKALANANAGFVVGLEGPWGCGKSSLLFLLEEALKGLDGVTVIQFRPWLINNRDALLQVLLTTLSDEIDRKSKGNQNLSQDMKGILKKASKNIRTYAAKLKPASELLSIIPGAETVGQVITKTAEMASKNNKSLLDLKNEVTNALKELNHRFIITIDDVDRLEPLEVVEILRVIRAVADFPYVTYVLCYEQEVTSRHIEQGAKVKDGAAFLEKIVQLTWRVPQPEPYKLEQWFRADLAKILGETQISDEARNQLDNTLDIWGPLLL